MGNSTSISTMLVPTLLARLGPQTTKEFQYFISEEDYSYFLNKTEEVRQDELSDSDYYMCRASVVQAFGVVRLGETFFFSHSSKGEGSDQKMYQLLYH